MAHSRSQGDFNFLVDLTPLGTSLLGFFSGSHTGQFLVQYKEIDTQAIDPSSVFSCTLVDTLEK